MGWLADLFKKKEASVSLAEGGVGKQGAGAKIMQTFEGEESTKKEFKPYIAPTKVITQVATKPLAQVLDWVGDLAGKAKEEFQQLKADIKTDRQELREEGNKLLDGSVREIGGNLLRMAKRLFIKPDEYEQVERKDRSGPGMLTKGADKLAAGAEKYVDANLGKAANLTGQVTATVAVGTYELGKAGVQEVKKGAVYVTTEAEKAAAKAKEEIQKGILNADKALHPTKYKLSEAEQRIAKLEEALLQFTSGQGGNGQQHDNGAGNIPDAKTKGKVVKMQM